jgi:hypothetical protein
MRLHISSSVLNWSGDWPLRNHLVGVDAHPTSNARTTTGHTARPSLGSSDIAYDAPKTQLQKTEVPMRVQVTVRPFESLM